MPSNRDVAMSTAGKIALGIFLTLMLQCQLGFFDERFNAYFEAQALADEDWLTRLLYPLVRPDNLIAESRAENPVAFLVLSAMPSLVITLVAYVFLAGIQAIARAGGTDAGSDMEEAEQNAA